MTNPRDHDAPIWMNTIGGVRSTVTPLCFAVRRRNKFWYGIASLAMNLLPLSGCLPVLSRAWTFRLSALPLLATLFVVFPAFAQRTAPDPALPPLPAAPANEATPAPAPQPDRVPAATPGALAKAPADVPPPAGPSMEQPPEFVPKEHVHHGFYLSAANGFGYVGVRGDGPNGSAGLSGVGSTVNLAIGGSLVPGLALAGVFQAGTLTNATFDGGPVVTVTSPGLGGTRPPANSRLTGHAAASTFLLGVQVDWFPVPQGGWHVGGSLGLGGATVTDDAFESLGGAGVAGSLFGGHQWGLGSDWSLGVSGFLMGGSNVKMLDKDRNDTGYRLTPVSVGVQWALLYY
ncbi:MAG: hypothetical protein M3O36_21720 [Myxococcota bacterium]|nr:hypothetical protein [Myxococcota bacterium]